MTLIEARQKLSRGIVIAEQNGTTMVDGDYTLRLLNEIFKEFDKELKDMYIKGSDANYKALKESGKLKGE